MTHDSMTKIVFKGFDNKVIDLGVIGKVLPLSSYFVFLGFSFCYFAIL